MNGLKRKNPANLMICRVLNDLILLSAEEEGFEPPDLLQSPVFKTGAINRSTTPLFTQNADFGIANVGVSGASGKLEGRKIAI